MIENEVMGFAIMMIALTSSICFGLYWFLQARTYKTKVEQNDSRLAKYEHALLEVQRQTGLMEFLDENDWATTEDYFASVAKDAMKKY